MIRLTCPVCNKPIPAATKSGSGCDTAALPGEEGRNVTAAEVVRPQSAGSLPFCSDRCRKIDLFRWFDGRYAIVNELSPDSLMAAENADAGQEDFSDNDL